MLELYKFNSGAEHCKVNRKNELLKSIRAVYNTEKNSVQATHKLTIKHLNFRADPFA